MELLLLGLDGADARLLPKLAKTVPLPRLHALFRESPWGPLLSTLPPSSPPAWTSLITGVAPSYHGVFHFRGPLDEKGFRPLLRTSHILEDRLWHLANRKGWKTGVVHLPVLYPTEPLDGFMVSGMLTPEKGKRWIFPPQWGDELEKELGKLCFHVSKLDAVEHVQALRHASQKITEASLWLLNRCRVDLFFIVFVLLDRIQHRFFPRILSLAEGVGGRDPLDREIVKALRDLDECIGGLLDAWEPSRIWLISDHGFGPIDGVVGLNKWLREMNLASFYRLDEQIPTVLAGGIEERIEWDRTLAYLSSPLESAILINTKVGQARTLEGSRRYRELLGLLKEGLEVLVHPDKGTPLFEAAIPRAELHPGPYAGRAADLFLIPFGQRIHLSIDPYEPFLVRSPREGEEGMHTREGLWLVHGKDETAFEKHRTLSCEEIPKRLLRRLHPR